MGLFDFLKKQTVSKPQPVSSKSQNNLRKINSTLANALEEQDKQIAAIHAAEGKYEQDHDIDSLISFWEKIWKQGGLLFNGSKWTFRLPDLYIKEKKYDAALQILQQIKNKDYKEKKDSYIKKVKTLQSKGK